MVVKHVRFYVYTSEAFFYELDEEKENSFEIFREVLEYRLYNGNMLQSILIFHSIFLTCDENNFIQNGKLQKTYLFFYSNKFFESYL